MRLRDIPEAKTATEAVIIYVGIVFIVAVVINLFRWVLT